MLLFFQLKHDTLVITNEDLLKLVQNAYESTQNELFDKRDIRIQTKLQNLEHLYAELQKKIKDQHQAYDDKLGRLEGKFLSLHQTVTYMKQSSDLNETTYNFTKRGKIRTHFFCN